MLFKISTLINEVTVFAFGRGGARVTGVRSNESPTLRKARKVNSTVMTQNRRKGKHATCVYTEGKYPHATLTRKV